MLLVGGCRNTTRPAEALHELAHAPGGHAGRIMRHSGRHIRYGDSGKATNPVDPYDLYDYKLQEDDDKPVARVTAPPVKTAQVASNQEADDDEDDKILGRLMEQYKATHHSPVAVTGDPVQRVPTPKPAAVAKLISPRPSRQGSATSNGNGAVVDDDYDDVPIH